MAADNASTTPKTRISYFVEIQTKKDKKVYYIYEQIEEFPDARTFLEKYKKRIKAEIGLTLEHIVNSYSDLEIGQITPCIYSDFTQLLMKKNTIIQSLIENGHPVMNYSIHGEKYKKLLEKERLAKIEYIHRLINDNEADIKKYTEILTRKLKQRVILSKTLSRYEKIKK